MQRDQRAAAAGGGARIGARFAKSTTAWLLLLLAAAGAACAQMTAGQTVNMDGLTPQERSLYLLKAAVNGETVRFIQFAIHHRMRACEAAIVCPPTRCCWPPLLHCSWRLAQAMPWPASECPAEHSEICFMIYTVQASVGPILNCCCCAGAVLLEP